MLFKMRGWLFLAALAALPSAWAQVDAAKGSRSESQATKTCAVVLAFPFTCRMADRPMQIEPSALVSDACVSFETLETLNNAVTPHLNDVTQNTDFFAYYRLNLYNRICPYWGDENAMCGNIACAVSTLDDEKDVPPIWRAEELSKLQGPKARHPGRQQQKDRGKRPLQGTLGEDVDEDCVVEYDDECDERDYCVPEDESATAKGDYVSLVDNPERFTGYAGKDSHAVWDAIYKENCFSKPSAALPSPQEGSKDPLNMFQAANDLRSVLQSGSAESLFDDTCLEKRVFYRLISGMHASISMHICHDYLDQQSGTWGPNLTCYTDRFSGQSEYLANLYFNYAITVRAVAKLEPYLRKYRFCANDPAENRETASKVAELAKTAASAPLVFDESVMFSDPGSGVELKEDFRNRFRNVSRLMDCVSCDKCRLWGKLQTAGYGTALKVLFEYDDEEDFELKRTELVALINTFARISHSIASAAYFQSTIASAASARDNHRTMPLAEEKARASPIEDDDVDLPFREWVPADNQSQSSWHQDSAVASFWQELDLVYRTTLYVLREWAHLPKKLGRMAVMEIDRTWRFWLGLPMPNIVYEWTRPVRKDEL